MEDAEMNQFEDERINEALELLNAVARDNKEELQAAIENKYTDLSAVVNTFTDQMKCRAAEKFEAGRRKVVYVATDINSCIHGNPWPYIGGVAAAAMLLGFVMGKSQRD
jgi:ElaB/YqjD/DUF883 family membrane-anchored ribosome-binding protein